MKQSMMIFAWLMHSLALAGEPAPRARALLDAFDGGQIKGTVELIQRGDTVQAIAQLEGLSPGVHAFHVHRYGDCASASGTGGHFDPAGGVAVTRSEHHGGDFGALSADENGRASLNILLTGISLAPAEDRRSVLGRSIVVHSSPDDFIEPSGPIKGLMLACGVIRPLR